MGDSNQQEGRCDVTIRYRNGRVETISGVPDEDTLGYENQAFSDPQVSSVETRPAERRPRRT